MHCQLCHTSSLPSAGTVRNQTGLSRRLMLLAALFGVAGIGHFVKPEPFERIVPDWIPQARLMVYMSGVAELAGAIGLLVPSLRKAAGWGLIALLIAVFPANINMLQLARAENADAWYQAALWIRLPLQPLLVWLIWSAAIRQRHMQH
ncbi:MAG: DoxX family protein [Phycisphaerae bacterium]|nr:DoxX family protein [Gemmatimonadaceae bacterium]